MSGEETLEKLGKSLGYVKQVKERLQYEADKYSAFVELSVQLLHKRVAPEIAVAQMKELLRGHNDLILGFNNLLPKEFHTKLPQLEDEEAAQKLMEQDWRKRWDEEANALILAIYDRFQDDSEKIKTLVQLHRDFNHKRVNLAGVAETVKEVLKGHRDLIMRFNVFLPNEYEIPVPPENSAGASQKRSGDYWPVEMEEEALAYIMLVKERFKEDRAKYKAFSELLREFRTKRIDPADVVVRVQELFKGHRDLILGLNIFLPEEYKITLPLDLETVFTDDQ